MAMTDAQQPSSIGRAIAGWSGRGLVERYGIAVIGVALGLALRAALASLLEGSGAYLFYVPAILAASALGGWGPGLFATILGLLSGLFFVTDRRVVVAVRSTLAAQVRDGIRPEPVAVATTALARLRVSSGLPEASIVVQSRWRSS